MQGTSNFFFYITDIILELGSLIYTVEAWAKNILRQESIIACTVSNLICDYAN